MLRASRQLAVLAITLRVAAAPAAAHEGSEGEAGLSWSFDPWVGTPLLIAGCLYATGCLRLWKRAGTGRGVSLSQAASFVCGWAALAAGSFSPLHELSGRLFLAHMSEHQVMMVLAAPLFALARPVGAMLWAMPVGWRAAIGGLFRRRGWRGFWVWLTHPLVATAIHVLAIAVWHLPWFYDLALASPSAHRLQHSSFFLSALLFWWSLLKPSADRQRHSAALAALFATMTATTAIGIFLTLSPRLLYERQSSLAQTFGLTALEDQQLAGLIMWIPGGFVYLAAALLLAWRWIEGPGTPHGAPRPFSTR